MVSRGFLSRGFQWSTRTITTSRAIRGLATTAPYRSDRPSPGRLGSDAACQPHGQVGGGWEKSIGVGDTVAKIIKRFTFGLIESCPRCRKRQDRLNRAVPY